MSNTDLADLREAFFDEEEQFRSIIDNALRGVITELPVMVSEDSKDGNTVKLKCALKLPEMQPDGTTKWVELPEFDDVVVHYPGAGGFSKTFPLKKGSEGSIVFGSRGISNWHDKGGVQPAVIMRSALSDGRFHPGSRSKPNALKGVSQSSTQTRSDDKQSLSDVSGTAVTQVRGKSVHQANDTGVLTQREGATQFLDARTIQNVAGKILLNC